MPKFKYLMILIFLTFLGIFIYFFFFHNPKTNVVSLQIKNKTFNLEVAKTPSQQMTGLMNRTSLCPNCGMIFVFGLELPQSFWMKNTHIPLDIIFLDKNGVVINIAQGQPESLDNIQSTQPSKFVIELNADTSAKIGLKSGDIIQLPSSL